MHGIVNAPIIFSPAQAAASLGTADSAVPLVKNPVSVFRPTCAMTGNALEPVIPRDSRREKFHLFISHMQNEASGDVGTLFFLFEQMGMRGWRDMNQDDLTESGMRQGVYDSDVFVLFLTGVLYGGCSYFILLVAYLQTKESTFAFGALCAFRLVLRNARRGTERCRELFSIWQSPALKLSNTAAFE